MENLIIIHTALLIIYFHIGGLATTNILRLTRGSTLPVLVSKCVCDTCGKAIPTLLQLPVISYLVCRGKCRCCGAIIPAYPLFIEIAVMLGRYIFSALFSLSPLGITLSFLYYELVRFITIKLRGKREISFAKNYAVAVLSMLPFYIAALFVSLLSSII